jgi:hypothetical protein
MSHAGDPSLHRDSRRHLSFISAVANSVVDARERILYESIVETLLTFGDSTRNAFIWQLKKKGIQMTPDKVDLREIESMLFGFFGDAAPKIVERICDGFTRKAKIMRF